MKNIQQLFIVAVLTMVTVATFAFTSAKNGKIIMVVTVEVSNYAEWKKGFDAGAPVREKAGIKVVSVCRSLENENQIIVIEEADSVQSANDFLAILKSKQKAGDMSKLNVKLYDKAE